MKYTNKQILSSDGKEYSFIFCELDNGAILSFLADPANTDCQAFLAWLKAGNFPQNPDGTTATQDQVNALITQLGG